MIRLSTLFRRLLEASATLVAAFTASVAGALGIDIVDLHSTGGSTTVLNAGDVLTVDLRLRNESRIDVYGIQVTAFGHDDDRSIHSEGALRWIGGERAESFFNTGRIGDFGFVGIGSIAGPREPHPFYIWRNPDPRMPNHNLVLAIEGLTVVPVNGSGMDDTGVDGFSIRDGDAHVRLWYQANAVSEDVQLRVVFGIPNPTALPGREEDHGYVVIGGPYARSVPFENDEWSVTVLATEDPLLNPEPTTAVLLGFGLIGLGLRRAD